MSKEIQPITALRDTAKLEKDLKENDGLLHITKNGYSDFVILSSQRYKSLVEDKVVPSSSTTFIEEKIVGGLQSDPLGFVKVRAMSTEVEVGGINHNKNEIIKAIKKASEDKVSILVLPELCLSGYTCNDLFLSDNLLSGIEKAVGEISFATQNDDVLVAYGVPLRKGDSLYNCAIVSFKGRILGVVPKSFIPNYGEFYEGRYFAEAPNENSLISIEGKTYKFGRQMIFVNSNYLKMKVGVEICEDLWVPNTPSTNLALNGANIILNLSASNEIIGKKEYRRDLVRMTSARLRAAYIYAGAGEGESTTDLVFASSNLIAEDGSLLAESEPFAMEAATAEIDLEKLKLSRLKATTFKNSANSVEKIFFEKTLQKPSNISRKYQQNPFIPTSKEIDLARVKSILDIQVAGLAKRLKTTKQTKAILGLSGGLDSTLALLVVVETFKKLGFDSKDIKALTLPAFGTSKRTFNNAKTLSEKLGVSFLEINIKESVKRHLLDIGHDLDNHNVAYENAQARERTQVLMDLANDENSLMVGTGDLSELCLGWCTYNGDHMSMYGVNSSIPKTLVRYLCQGYALLHPETKDVLEDIIETPISPELLPPDALGHITQMTEDKVGPYDLNDFFIYHYLRFGYRPKKLFLLANLAYQGKYEEGFIKKWLRRFFERFFHSQFKKSCLPDGPKVGSVAVSPRGDLRMPSDASVQDYLDEIDTL